MYLSKKEVCYMGEKKNNQLEEALKFDIGQFDNDDSRQFTQVDELYAIEEASKREEETAQEFSGDFQRPMYTSDSDTNTIFGWIGIIAAIASFFMWPMVMGIAGIVLGFISKRQGADGLGNTAITISVISIL